MATSNELQVSGGSSSMQMRTSAKDVHEMLKGSFFLDASLPEMLSRAPMAAQLMGMLYILASSEAATKADVMKPGKFVRHDNLPANLNALVHKGMNAFDQARRSMYTIKTKAQAHYGSKGTIMRIVALLADEEFARVELGPRMQILKEGTDQCADAARLALQNFDEWKNMAQELVELASTGRNNAEKQKRAREEQARRQRRQLELQEENKKQAEESVRLYKLRVKEREKDYREALEKTKSVKRAVGEILLAESLNTVSAIPRTVTRVTDAATEIAKESVKAVGNFGSILSSGDRNPYAQDQTPQSSTNRSDEASISHAPAAPDPALQAAGTVLQALEELRAAWTNGAASDPSAKDTQGPVQAALDRLLLLQEELQQIGSSGAQQLTTTVLQPTIAIGRTASNTLQQELDETTRQGLIRDWELKLQGPLDQAISLKTKASLQPGQAFGARMPLLPHLRATIGGDERVLSPTIFMEKRARDLLIMENGMESAMRSCDEKSAALAQTQAKIVALSSQLEDLETSQATLDQISKFLLEAISSINSLQAEIWQLANYFDSISQDITTLVEAQCNVFINTLNRATSDNGLGEGCLALYAQDIYESLLQARSKFAVVQTQAIFYEQVSNDYIVPAIRDVCRLPIHLDREQQSIARNRLTESTNTAANAILEQGRAHQQTIRQGLQALCENVHKEIANASPALRQQMTHRRKNLIRDAANKVEELRDEEIQK
ncbi:hypothetical protein diail_1394, partial [Diaporthe ilicicola]